MKTVVTASAGIDMTKTPAYDREIVITSAKQAR
jgi:hypothetical protein